MASRVRFLLVGLCACGVAQEPEPPEDPEQRAIERVLAEPDPHAHAHVHPHAQADAQPDPAAPAPKDFPWLHDLVARPDDPDLAAAIGRLEAESSTGDPLFDRFALQLLRGDAAAWKDAALTLVRDAPTSRFVPYVYLALTEHSLRTGHPSDAVELAAKVLTFDNAHARAFAFHALAWGHEQSSPPNHEEALHAFARCIAETKRPEHAFPASARALRTAARRDLVVPFAAVGDPNKARDFFEHIGRGPGDEDLVEEMLSRLAAQ